VIEQNGRPDTVDETISITRSKTFGFSKALCQRYDLVGWSSVVLYYDAYRKRVAFRFTNDRTRHSRFTLKKTTSGSMTIRANGFFSAYNIEVPAHARKHKTSLHASCDLGINEDGDSFVIQLRGRRGVSAPGDASVHDGAAFAQGPLSMD
jgi:hypothetical protein